MLRGSYSSPLNPCRLALKKIAELLVKIHAHTEAVAVANEHKMDDILKSLKL